MSLDLGPAPGDDPLAGYEPGHAALSQPAPPDPRPATAEDAAQICTDSPPEHGGPDGEQGARSAYLNTAQGFDYSFCDRKGDSKVVRLSNWTARIVADVTHDDGGVPRRAIVIQARQNGRTATFEVSSEELVRVQDWALGGLGASARVYVHPQVQAHLLLAVQEASAGLERRTVFTHTGWRRIEGQMAYLHGGGAIGAAGALPGVEVALPGALGPQDLPAPATGGPERAALRAALDLLVVAPDVVMVAVLGAVWRAPLGESDLAVWVTGPTGAGKTEVTALAQQHFGAHFDARHLPAAWSGTANSLNELAYLAKDMLFTVDDFVPKGASNMVARLHATADAVIRAQGNGAGRSRLDAEAHLRDSRPPRGTLLASGEDVPHGQSLRARLLVVDLGPGDLDFALLSAAQVRAREGTFATAMAGYVRWLAAHPSRLGSVCADVERHREQAVGAGAHRRTATLVAHCALGWRTVIDYSLDSGALEPAEAELVWDRVQAALLAAGAAQSQQDVDADPASRFLELVGAALSSGQAHLATPQGMMPDQAQRWGWRRDDDGPAASSWRPMGARVGYVDAADLYLLPAAVMKVATALTSSGEPVVLGTSALAKRLRERGILLADEHETRGTLTVRKQVGGRRAETWHLRAAALGADGAAPAGPGQYPPQEPF